MGIQLQHEIDRDINLRDGCLRLMPDKTLLEKDWTIGEINVEQGSSLVKTQVPEYYRLTRNENLPAAEKIDPEWMSFQYTMICLVWHLTNYSKNGQELGGPLKKDNEIIDKKIVSLAVRAGALMTADLYMGWRFLLSKPDGKLFFVPALKDNPKAVKLANSSPNCQFLGV